MFELTVAGLIEQEREIMTDPLLEVRIFSLLGVAVKHAAKIIAVSHPLASIASLPRTVNGN